ncbi:penicillin-binding transpeptidase domain-containing protein, partial [Achromobacter xylosoxidans]
NGGYRVTPYLIDKVTDRSGNVLMQAQPVVAGDAAARAIDPRTAWVMDDILRGVTTSGTAARAHQVLKRNDIGGKTGTTNEAVDVWFSGFTPSLATTVWMGFDQPKSLGTNEFGSGLALTTWLDYMQPALKGVPEAKPAPRPDGLLVDNGEYYFNEFPPGQAVASLDLSSGDPLTDFLNNNRSTDGVDNSVRPLPAPGAAQPPATPPQAGAPQQARQVPTQQVPAQQAPVAQPIPVPAAGGGALGGTLGDGAGNAPPIPPIPVPRVEADPVAGPRASVVSGGNGPLAARPL